MPPDTMGPPGSDCLDISVALAQLARTAATKPLADLLQSLLQTAGIPVDVGEPVPHSQQVKDSLQAQRTALDKLHRIEKAQAARKAKIESLQAQIDPVTKEFVKGKEELELARADSDQAQEDHRKLLDEPEFSDRLNEDADIQDAEQGDGDINNIRLSLQGNVRTFMPWLKPKSAGPRSLRDWPRRKGMKEKREALSCSKMLQMAVMSCLILWLMPRRPWLQHPGTQYLPVPLLHRSARSPLPSPKQQQLDIPLLQHLNLKQRQEPLPTLPNP